MEHGVLEEGVKGDMIPLLLVDEHVGDGYQDFLKFVAYGVFELQFPGSLVRVDPGVIGQVDGNGLAAGIAKVLKTADSNINVIGVSMESAPAMYHSLKAGKPVEIEEKDSIADALLGGIGLDNEFTFPMIEKYVDRIELVTEKEIERGILSAHENHGILIEGAAAVTLAYLLKRGKEIPGKNIVGILSGGNVDTKLIFNILSGKKNNA